MISSNNLLLRRNVLERLIGCMACHGLPALKPPEVGGGVVSVRRPGEGHLFQADQRIACLTLEAQEELAVAAVWAPLLGRRRRRIWSLMSADPSSLEF